jgi:hypothetical protein
MSLLERAQPIDTEGTLKEITEVIKSFYTDDNLEKISELDNFMIVGLTKLDYYNKVIKEEFGYDVELDEDLVKALEKRFVSHNRMGRTEGMSTLSAQLQQILMHPQTALRRMFGIE